MLRYFTHALTTRTLTPGRLLAGIALCLALLAVGPVAFAAGPPATRAIDPKEVQGVLRPGREVGQVGREIASALLFLPRKLEALLFHVQVFTARVIRDEHIVSRADQLLSPGPGALTFFPTLFFVSRQRPSAGIRVLARSNHVATSLAAGIGGVHDLTMDDRIHFSWTNPFPVTIDVEALADARSRLVYNGLGPSPEADARNHFRPGVSAREAHYLEQRRRGILSFSLQFHRYLDLVVSGSYTLSRIATESDEVARLDRVFLPGTVPGTVTPTHIFYGESTIHFDTRPVIGRPTAGALFALYAGIGRGTGDDPTSFYRVGGRVAAFLPIIRRSNILSLKVVIDGIVPGSSDAAAIPFTALVGQPEFRGFDTRRDQLGVVASVDYQWSLMHLLGARLFADAASVAPQFTALAAAPPRVAAGFGIDFFGETHELAQLAVAFTTEGVRLLLSFGLPTAFHDRQHRD
ncbi:MAG: hypothetical protein ABI193_09795 [Minicystis sp.]